MSSFLLVPGRVSGIVSLVSWHSVPSLFPGSGYGSGGCLPSLLAFCSIIMSWFHPGCGACLPSLVALCSIMISCSLLVPASVQRLVSPLFFSFLRKRSVCHRDFLVPSGSGLGGLSPFFLSLVISRIGGPMNSLLRMNVVETWFVAVWGLCWYNL